MKPIMRFYNAIIAAYKDRFSISLPALLLFFATFTLAGAANAAPLTYMASAKGVNTVTLQSHQAGDVLIAWAVRDGSDTSPSLPAGWTSIRAAGASKLSYVLAWKTATSSSEAVGTFSNATSLIISQYRPGDGYTVSMGATNSKANSSSLTATYNSLALQNTDGSSWVLAFFAHRSSNIGGLSTAPTGMVNRSFDQDAVDSVAVHSTPAGVSSWSTEKQVTYTGTSAAYRTAVLELKLTPPTGGGLSWQLDEGHYEPRVADMTIVHPRTNAAAHAQHLNAHPGIPWSTHVDVIGGSYPFKFELAGNVPAGMTIGGELTEVGDVLEAGENYGVITWPNPTAGQHQITVNVYDQQYQRDANPSILASVTFTLNVNASRFVFIDPTNGHDSNAGTLASPLRSIYALHNGSSNTNTYAGKNVYLRGGVHNLNGMSTNYNNYAMFPDRAPNVFIGYPGETAVLSLYQGWFVGRGATDIMLKDLTIEHAGVWTQEQRFFWGTDPQLGNSFHNVVFRNYRMGGLTASPNNPALTFYSGTDGEQYHSNISFNHCDFTGAMGNISTTYTVRNFSFQHNRIHGINTTGNSTSNNHYGFVYFKSTTENVEVRSNNIWENNVFGAFESLAGIGGFQVPGTPYAFNNIRYSYNKIGNLSNAFLGKLEGGGTPGTVYGFRNSTITRVADEGLTGSPVINRWSRNAVENGFHNMSGNFEDIDNHLGTSVLDAQLKLDSAYRTQYLGTVGAEVR